jgi:thiol-disulfide isomerase/thioredoxin
MRWLVIAVAALLVGLLTYGVAAQGTDQTIDSALSHGRRVTAPGGTLPRLGSRTEGSVADYKGKVVLVNFWATWCGPCKMEIPDMVKLYSQYKEQGLVVVGISIDDSPAQLQTFMRELHMNYPVVQMRPEVEDAWGPFYGYPTSFIVARDGSICTKHIGPATHDQFESEIRGLL